jgi:hypothetical protein
MDVKSSATRLGARLPMMGIAARRVMFSDLQATGTLALQVVFGKTGSIQFHSVRPTG